MDSPAAREASFLADLAGEVLGEIPGQGTTGLHMAVGDRCVVRVSLTPSGRRKIEELFPRFNAEEASVASVLSAEDQDHLAAMLRGLLSKVEAEPSPSSP